MPRNTPPRRWLIDYVVAAEDESPATVKKLKSSPAGPSKPKKSAKTESKKSSTGENPGEEVASKSKDAESDVETDDETKALLQTLDSDDDVEEQAVPEKAEPARKLGKIPKPAKSAKKSPSSAETEKPGVVYVGRIPHGFYEHEMRQYFSQFGPVTNLRLSRNKKTGASRHYAFVEFESENTASIVARTMDNYLLFGHILKCKVVPQAHVHEKLWKGANRRFKKVPWGRMAGYELKRPATESTWNQRLSKEEKRRSTRAAKLKAIGYDFEGPELQQVADLGPAPPLESEGDAPVSEVKLLEGPKDDRTEEATETAKDTSSSSESKAVAVIAAEEDTTKVDKGTKAAKKDGRKKKASKT